MLSAKSSEPLSSSSQPGAADALVGRPAAVGVLHREQEVDRVPRVRSGGNALARPRSSSRSAIRASAVQSATAQPWIRLENDQPPCDGPR